MKKPKVVVQYPFIPLYRVPVFRKLAASDRYDFVFWAAKNSPDKYLKSIFNESGLPVEEVPLILLRIPIINKILEFQFSAIQKLIKTRPDVYIILANPNSVTSWLCMVMARFIGCKVLAWSHGFLADEKGLRGLIRTFFYKIPHGHLLYGDTAKEIMIEKGFDPQKIDVIYNSLDYEKQSMLRDTLSLEDKVSVQKGLNIPENSIVLIAIGRLVSKLKLDQAIVAVERLNKLRKKVYLLVIGDGPEKGNLIRLANSLNISDRIIFYGACHKEEELSYLFNASDISIAMGTVGLSAMHSLGYGIPLITNYLDRHGPEIEAIKEGETGWFFKKDNIESFASKVRTIAYRGDLYKKCISTIESRYTPEKQRKYIENAIGKQLG